MRPVPGTLLVEATPEFFPAADEVPHPRGRPFGPGVGRIPARLRDPAYPDDLVDFRHWNAQSVFFFDPAGTIVEYIAGHDLQNATTTGFGDQDLTRVIASGEPMTGELA
jgi:hypothetical protein